MSSDDVDAGLRLCRQSHWNQVARDWRQFLDLTPGGASVAVDARDGVIGSVAMMRYRALEPRLAGSSDGPETRDGAALHSLAWIAMVLVDPSHRGGGVGTALLQHALEQASDAAAIGLDATPLGQPLYEKLGFRADARFSRVQRARAAGAEVGQHVEGIRPAARADLDGIAELDALATGLDRRAMLAWLLDGAPEYAWVCDGPRGVIQGALLGRHGHDASHLGPIVAASDAIAIALLHACGSAHAATPFFLDMADGRPGWRTAVESLGFAVQRPFTRMYRGTWRPTGDPNRLFAIIGPEFG
jgi:GNAT superfamily N-acetyltransferase